MSATSCDGITVGNVQNSGTKKLESGGRVLLKQRGRGGSGKVVVSDMRPKGHGFDPGQCQKVSACL